MLTLPTNHQTDSSDAATTSTASSDARRNSTTSNDEGGSVIPLEDPKRLPKSHPAHIWPGVAQQLALALKVDSDIVKRRLVCELYMSGYDAIAQEVMYQVVFLKLSKTHFSFSGSGVTNRIIGDKRLVLV